MLLQGADKVRPTPADTPAGPPPAAPNGPAGLPSRGEWVPGAITTAGGLLCAASCSSHVGRDAFVATVRDGARDAGRRAQIREIHGAAFDHPVVPQFPEGDYLKFAVVDL